MFSLECLSKLFEQARNGNAQARDQLVLDNTGLVWSVVKKYRGRGYEQEDLFQIGCIGLMKAIDRFDQTFFNLCSANDNWRDQAISAR